MGRDEIIAAAFDYYKSNGVPNADTDGYKEDQLHVFRPSGYYHVGEYTVPADFFPMEKGFRAFMFKGSELINCDADIDVCTVSLAPLLSCKVWFIRRWFGYYGYPVRTAKLETLTGKKICGYYSENDRADFIFKICEAYGIRKNHTNPNMQAIYNDPSTDVHFRHCVYNYGFNNNIYIEYRFDDLLNMDVNELDALDVKTLKHECERHPFLKKVVNFKVFKRPLTDIEKTSCTTKFFNEFKKQIKKNYRVYAAG